MHFDPDQKQALFDAMCEMPTVDAHEHLHSEAMRTERDVDIFLLFHQYLRVDLILAGMAEEDANALEDPGVPLDRKWETFEPAWDLVRTTAVAQAPLAALRRSSTRMISLPATTRRSPPRCARTTRRAATSALRDACNIVLVLNQGTRTMWQTDIFRPILPRAELHRQRDPPEHHRGLRGGRLRRRGSLGGCWRSSRSAYRQKKAEGMIGIKGHGFGTSEVAMMRSGPIRG